MVKRKRHDHRQIGLSEGVSVQAFLEWLDREFQARQNNPNPPYPYNQETNTLELPTEVEKELLELLKMGSKVEAVRRVTKLTGAGLRVSKDYVDGLLLKL